MLGFFVFVGGLILIPFVLDWRERERERELLLLLLLLRLCVAKGKKEESGGSQCHILWFATWRIFRLFLEHRKVYNLE